MLWLRSFLGTPPDRARRRLDGDYTDEETISIVRTRLEQQARRIAILDAQVDTQRSRHH